MSSKILNEFRVLLVEDEEVLASLLKNAIGDSFKSFTLANNGKDGLEKFLQINPDIVITDIMMPKLTGLEMAKKIRELDSDIPIIILSAFSESDKFLDAIDVGVVKYFIKPFDPDELFEYIQTLGDKLGSRTILLCDNFSFNFSTKSLYKDA
jgi:YesN/AraC family two-component response regulator